MAQDQDEVFKNIQKPRPRARDQHASLLLAGSYGKDKYTKYDSFTMTRVENCLYSSTPELNPYSYGRPLSVSGRPFYILPMFFLFFFMAALFSGPGERRFAKVLHVVDLECH